jgi:hypothetical protein
MLDGYMLNMMDLEDLLPELAADPILRLRYMYGYTHKEICDILGHKDSRQTCYLVRNRERELLKRIAG